MTEWQTALLLVTKVSRQFCGGRRDAHACMIEATVDINVKTKINKAIQKVQNC
jgi:hypothetical protein